MKTTDKLTGNKQKQAEQFMNAGLQLLPVIMDNIPQAVFWKDRNLVYLGCNQAFADDAGFSSPDEIVGKSDFDMPWKDQAELYRADDQKVLKNGKPKLNYEEPQTAADGSTTWLNTSKIPVRENGRVVAVLGMYEDITARKQAEEAIKVEQKRNQMILDAIPVPTVISRMSDGLVVYANEAMAQVGRIDLDTLIGARSNYFANPDDQKKVAEIISKQGQISDYETQLRRGDGSLYWVLLSARKIDYWNAVCVLSSYIEITASKHAEEAIRESEDRFRRFSEATIEGLVFHEQGKIVDANPAGVALFGFADASEIIGKNLLEFILPEFHTLVLQKMQSETVSSYEVRGIRQDGSTFPFETSTRAYYIGDRQIRASTLHDITERKQAEATLQRTLERQERQSRRLQAIIAASNELHKTPDLDTIYRRAVELAREKLGIERCGLFLLDPTKKYLIGSYGTDSEGHTTDERAMKNPIKFYAPFEPTADKVWNMTEGPRNYWKDGKQIDLGTGWVVGTVLRSAGNEPIGVIYNDAFLSGTPLDEDLQDGLALYCSMLANIIERKKVEETLSDSEERFRSFTEATREGLVFHENGKIVDANPAVLAMYGLPHDEIIGRNLLEFVVPEAHELVLQHLKSERVEPYEINCIRSDGSIFPIETSTQIYKTGGRTLRATSVSDITQRKQAEQTLQESEARYSAVVNQANDGVIIIQDNTCQFANQVLADMLGYTPEEMLGMSFIGFVASESRPLVVDRVKARLAGEVVETVYEAMLQRKDGTLFDAELSAGVIQYRGKSADVGIIRDITERKKTEEAIQQNAEKFRTIADFTYGWETWLNPEGKFLYVSPACERISEYAPGEFIDHPDLFAEIAHPEDRSIIEAHLREHRSTADTKPIEYRIITKSGQVRWVSHACQTVYDSSGAWQGRRGSNLDISERKNLEHQIQTAFENRGRQVQLSTQVSQSITTSTDVADLYERVVKQVKEQFGYYHTQLLRYDPVQNAVVLVTGYGETGAKMLAAGHRLPMGEGLIGTAAATGQTVLRPVLENDPNWRPNPLLPDTKGEIAVPIKLGDAVLGVLDVQSSVAGALGTDEQLLLEGLCGQIATAIESTRLRQEMTERLAEIDRLYRAMSHEGWRSYRETNEILASFMFDQSGLRQVKDIELADELFAKVPLTVPSGEVIGNLAVADDPQRPISSEDQDFIKQVSEQVALALESARLFEQTQVALGDVARHAEELETVAALSATTSTVLDPDKLLQAVVDLTKERFGLYHAHIYLADESWQTLLLAAGAGEIGRQLVAEQHTIPMNAQRSLVARAVRERRGVIVNDVRGEADFLPNPLLPETRSEMAVPMIVGDTLLGVFDVQSDHLFSFSKEDADIYTTLAAQVSVALQNARLYVEQAATVSQLRELDRLKSSFLANMSHELRTPLNSILGFADVIREGLDGPLTDNMENDLGLIYKNGQHLLHLINDVLDMAKIEAGRMNLQPENFILQDLINEVTSLTSTFASEKSLSLFIEEGSDQEVEIYADRTRIRQVMINLVNNAIKFTERGKIAISAKQRDDHVLISVRDSGIGIPPEKLEAVFQEFIQVDTSSTRKVGGTGLGLPISRKLVEMHGGRVWAESTGIDGEGSTFYVDLPLKAEITEPEQMEK